VRTILGIDGSIQLGLEEIQEIKRYALHDTAYFYREEVAAINSYILFYQANQKEKAQDDLNQFNLAHENSPLIAFLKASMALRSGQNEDCIRYIKQSPIKNGQATFYYLDFMLGRSLLYKLDPNADTHILKYLSHFKGQHFIKEAYQKLAWHALAVKGDADLYEYYMQQCLSKGQTLLDEDKQALREAKSGSTPNPIILKARLLYDGGYYHQAYQHLILHQEVFTSNRNALFELEYNYRLGRTLQQLKNYQDAVHYLAKVIDLGQKETTYFACASALQIGQIYEQQGEFAKSKMYYRSCLTMSPDEYKTTLHQKAKSGLLRLGE